LAASNLRGGADDADYNHIHPQNLKWSNRFPRILTSLVNAHTDLIVLQEVDKNCFDEDFLPGLRQWGYDGVLQFRKSYEKHAWGCATFWKTCSFEHSSTDHRSRAILTFLKETKTGEAWCIANCHLEGHPLRVEKRLMQVQSLLQRMQFAGFGAGNNIIIAGDFNCGTEGASSQWLMEGKLPSKRQVFEFGQSLQNCSKYGAHPFRFACAYDVNDTEPSYRQHPRGGHRVDHIFVESSAMDVVGRRQLASEKLDLECCRLGSPNKINGSDHLPIGAVVQLRPDRKPAAANAVDATPVCTLTAAQMDTLTVLLGASVAHKKGKPSSAEIKTLKAHAKEVKSFVEKLDKEQQEWVAKFKKGVSKAQKNRAVQKQTGDSPNVGHGLGLGQTPPSSSSESTSTANAAAQATAVLLPPSFKAHMGFEGRQLLARKISGRLALDFSRTQKVPFCICIYVHVHPYLDMSMYLCIYVSIKSITCLYYISVYLHLYLPLPLNRVAC
jgi:endonuclease/exonuclease/phosphatase family metal-dependent hydrolase